MLKTISPLISPELLKVLAEMGHGDEIIFSDAHFPAHSMGPQVIRADGLLVSDLLQAIIPLFELDSYAPPLVMMAAVEGDTLDPEVERRYRNALSLQAPCPDIIRINRFAFYERAQKAFSDRYHRRTSEVREYSFKKRGNTVISYRYARMTRAVIE